MTVYQFPQRDDEPEKSGPDLTAIDGEGEFRELLPEWAASLEDLRAAVRYHAGRHWHAVLFHGIRSPQYVLRTLGWSVRGGHRQTKKLMRWWHWPEGWVAESHAAAAGRAGTQQLLQVHTVGQKTRAKRGTIIALSAAVALAAVLAGIAWLPPYAWAALAVTGALVLAYHGRTEGRPLVESAIIPPRYAPPTPAIITRALGSLGISGINQVINDGTGLAFVTDVHRDGEGWGVELDLPYGVTAKMVLQRREQLASGLRRPLSAVWPEGVPHEHEGRLRLWIGFTDLSKVKPKPSPLVKAPSADIFDSLPFGNDPRGRPIRVPVFEANWLIGSAPGQGKTNAVRNLACGVALDPLCDEWIHELRRERRPGAAGAGLRALHLRP